MEETESVLDLILKNQEGTVQNLNMQTCGDSASPSPASGTVRSERIRSETAEAAWKWMSQQLDQERQERQRLLEWFSGEYDRLRKADAEKDTRIRDLMLNCDAYGGSRMYQGAVKLHPERLFECGYIRVGSTPSPLLAATPLPSHVLRTFDVRGRHRGTFSCKHERCPCGDRLTKSRLEPDRNQDSDQTAVLSEN